MQANALQSLGGLPVILIVFAGVAIFLILRLRSVLGRRVGFERPPMMPPNPLSPQPSGPVIEGQALPAQSGHPVPPPSSPLGQKLMQIVSRDPHFDPPDFLAQAEAAFRQIVTAFAAGNRAALQPLLTPHVFETFDTAIREREQAGERHQTEIKSIPEISIEDAQLLGDTAAIVLRFTSDQVNMVLDAQGNPKIGTDAVTELTDLWTFERDLKAPAPVWRLAAARNG